MAPWDTSAETAPHQDGEDDEVDLAGILLDFAGIREYYERMVMEEYERR